MARHIGWSFVLALACAAPASPASICELPRACGQQQAARPPAGKDQRATDGKDKGAQDHRPWKFWQGDTQTELGISAQQSADIEQVFQSTLPKLEAATQKIHKLEATLSQTIKDNTADLATVSQQIDRVEAARAQLYKTRTLMLYRMRGLLSADQRTKLQAMVDRWEARRKGTEPNGRR